MYIVHCIPHTSVHRIYVGYILYLHQIECTVYCLHLQSTRNECVWTITFSIRLSDFCFSIRPCRRQSHSLISIATHNTFFAAVATTTVAVADSLLYWRSNGGAIAAISANSTRHTDKSEQRATTKKNWIKEKKKCLRERKKNGLQMYRFICSITFLIIYISFLYSPLCISVAHRVAISIQRQPMSILRWIFFLHQIIIVT